MGRRVLVVYASKYGSTEGVAREIGAVLSERGHDVAIRRVQDAADPQKYDVIVAGSPIYASRVRKELVRFFEQNRKGLAGKRLALFAVAGSLADDTPENRAQALRALAVLHRGRDPVATGLFAGAVDLSKMPLPVRWLMRALKAKAGDHRDWEKIRAWAGELAESLSA